jgi:DNA-binding NtrC family response regulator
MSVPEVLIVEDEKNLRELMRDLLSTERIAVTEAETIAAAEAHLATRAPDLLLVDLKLPDGDGLQLLEHLRERGLSTAAIVVTAFGTVERAVQAMRTGAADFLVKPFDNERLKSAVAAALERNRKLDEAELFANVVGAGGGLKNVVSTLRRVAASDATVLIRGESGTGKQVIARTIHDCSSRIDGVFAAIDCSAIAPSLLESELFGFERGSFTGAHAQHKGRIESADGGTLFLDEIGDMPLEAQSRLLHVIQEREITRIGGRAPVKVDVRIIAATHRDLEKLAAEGRFRQDLLYRLNVVPLVLPPLRERKEDIPGLVEHFALKHARRHKVEEMRPSREVLSEAMRYTWPGNVRELENYVERAVVLGYFDTAIFTAKVPTSAPNLGETQPSPAAVVTLRQAVQEAERAAVVAALRHAQGNKAQAARLLGVSYKTLFNKIHEHEIREALMID